MLFSALRLLSLLRINEAVAQEATTSCFQLGNHPGKIKTDL